MKLSQLFSRPKNQQDLINILAQAAEQKLIEPSAFHMIDGVLKVYQRQVRDIMVPRSQMVVIESKSSLKEILPTLISSAHSRFPVIGETKDEIIGVLLAKDLLPFIFNKDQIFNIHSLIRPVAFIPESKRLHVLLEEFRIKHNHLAIVVDEYGGISGMLTIEDVLEEIVGEIEDEYDIEQVESHIVSLDNLSYYVKALTPIEEFNTYFGTSLSNEQFDTMGGLVTMYFGHLPKRNEVITVNGFTFTVLHAGKRKIRLLKVTPVGGED